MAGDDEWELSLEELDSLERDAFQKLANLRNNPSSSTAPSCSATSTNDILGSGINGIGDEYHNIQCDRFQCSPVKPNSPSPSIKVKSSSIGSIVLPSKLKLAANNETECSGNFPKLSVKFFLHSSGNIAAKFPYNEVLVSGVRKIPKSTWSAKERLWLFPQSSLPSAEKVLSDVDAVKIEVDNLDKLAQRAIGAASSLPDLRERYERIPINVEAKLLPFQREGVRFILQHGGRALLADEMGLGKTLQAIAVTACIHESWPVLILTPSSLQLQWASMIQQWLNIPSSDIVVVLSQTCGSNKYGFTIISLSKKGGIHLDGSFNIISYDGVLKLQTTLLASDFKVVIADESHYLKNGQAKRTTASLPVLKSDNISVDLESGLKFIYCLMKAQYAILLSGTPALSRPIELFKQLEALYPKVYTSVHEYGNRYCKGGTFGVYQGASNHEELHNLMKATVMIRRLKKDVLSELPVKRRQQVFLDLAEKDIKQIRVLFCELEVLKGKIKACNIQEDLESLKFSQKNIINKIYNDSAEAKIPAVLDYLKTVIEAGCKFLIFAHHQPMIDSLYQFLHKKKVGCIRIDGSTPPASRQALVTDFQEKDSVKAAVLSIKAGGVGLTLTAASTVIFAELAWTPGELIQAEDRAHRIGQMSSVNIYYLLASDTVDDIIWDVVQHKLENLGQMLDGHENTMEVSVVQQSSSPYKQKTLDSFIKRCNMDNIEKQSKQKYPRH